MAAAANIGTGVATNVTNAIIGLLIQQLRDVMDLGDNLQLLNVEFARMEVSLRHIHTQFESQQKKLPEIVERCLERMRDALQEATVLIRRTNRQRGRCLGCCILCSPKIPVEVRQWKNRFDELFRQLKSALSIAASTAQIVESAPPRAEVLLQPLPESGFLGSGIADSAQKVLTWLNESHPQARVIGVYGMAGVGKTSLLELIHNTCQKKVSSNFDCVIWFTVSQNYNIESLQHTIAKSLSVDVKGISSIEERKRKLYSSLENKRFLLIVDDLWSPNFDLNQVGVNFGHDNKSRVLISSRFRDVFIGLVANEYCIMMQPLSTEEGWELFRRKAFTNGVNGVVPEAIAREVASECKGLPLAINTVAAAMSSKETADDWSRTLVLMKNVDPSFPSTHRTIDAGLYQRLRWSYNDLPYDLKMCFLYCAAFPEDAQIGVERLVEWWAAESLVPHTWTTYLMDAGRQYIDALVDRCLIQYVDAKKEAIKVHDVLRDLAIYIGQKEENWLFLAGQLLQNFPGEEQIRDRKRISVSHNEISQLPADLECPTLVSLLLLGNYELKEIPERFLTNIMSLKVLDLSGTSIETLPTSVGQLPQLAFLQLSCCRNLKNLPDSICNLSRLQFLNLDSCLSLNSLPDRIGELTNLKHLNLDCCISLNPLPDSIGELKNLKLLSRLCPLSCLCRVHSYLEVSPRQISQLTSLNKLMLSPLSTPMNVEDLINLSNLIELCVDVKPEIRGSMSTWSQMRKLTLKFCWSEDENSDDEALDILPQSMQTMKELQSLYLDNYPGASLPNCICQFQNLNYMCLIGCSKLKELPALVARGGFPMLERLELFSLDRLESIVWNEGTMSKLQKLEIVTCKVLQTVRMEQQLPNLRYVRISDCDKLEELVVPSGGFPMLEELYLEHLPSLESVTVPLSVWSEETMPKLEVLHITGCLLLRRLPIEKLPNVNHIIISKCPVLDVEIGNCVPLLDTLILRSLPHLQSIAWTEETTPKLQVLSIEDCLFRRFSMEKLPTVKEIEISHCPELIDVEIGNCFPLLENLKLHDLPSLESVAWSEQTMPKLKSLAIQNCSSLRRLSLEKLPNIKKIMISHCPVLEVEIGNCFPLLENLKLHDLPSLESVAWSEQIMPKLSSLETENCSSLRRLSLENLPNLKKIMISHCPVLEVEIGNCLPLLENLKLHDLPNLESVAWSEQTMPKLLSLEIENCSSLRRLSLEKLPNIKKITISHCPVLEVEICNSFPLLKSLWLHDLPSLESVAWSEETMPKLESLGIKNCSLLRRLSLQKLPKVEYISISHCPELQEVEIGNLPMIETLDLEGLEKLEGITRPSNIWNERTMPKHRELSITDCPLLKSLPSEIGGKE